MPFDIGIPELILIFVMVLVVFGPQKIPELARELGKFVADVRRVGGEFTRELTGEMNAPSQSPARRMCPRCATPNPIGNYFCFQCGMNLVEAKPNPPAEVPPPSNA